MTTPIHISPLIVTLPDGWSVVSNQSQQPSFCRRALLCAKHVKGPWLTVQIDIHLHFDVVASTSTQNTKALATGIDDGHTSATQNSLRAHVEASEQALSQVDKVVVLDAAMIQDAMALLVVERNDAGLAAQTGFQPPVMQYNYMLATKHGLVQTFVFAPTNDSSVDVMEDFHQSMLAGAVSTDPNLDSIFDAQVREQQGFSTAFYWALALGVVIAAVAIVILHHRQRRRER